MSVISQIIMLIVSGFILKQQIKNEHEYLIFEIT